MTTGPAGIADDADALTAEWLTEALTSVGLLDGVRIDTVSAVALGTGQMSDSVRVTVSYDAPTDAPSSLVAKFSAADETSRATAVMLRSYEREVRFYRELDTGLDVATPEVFYADIDDTGGRFVLLLEDLAPAVQGDQLAGCTPEVAAAGLRQLVGLHVPRWDDDSLGELEWLRGDLDEERSKSLALLPMLWEGFLDRYATGIDDMIRTAGSQVFGSLPTYLDQEGPTTVVHGDFRLDNLLVHPETGAVTVVDWQTCTVGKALSDVAYLLGAGLLPDDRRTHELDLVRAYHRDLVEAGVTDYGWDTCWQDYRRGTWSGLIVAVGASMLVERTERGDQMFLAMASRHAQHAIDLEAADLLT